MTKKTLKNYVSQCIEIGTLMDIYFVYLANINLCQILLTMWNYEVYSPFSDNRQVSSDFTSMQIHVLIVIFHN